MKNKTVLSMLVIVVILSGVFLIVATKKTVFAQNTTTNLLTYANSTYGIKMQYPSSWDKQVNVTKQGTETDVVTFYPRAMNSNASLAVSIDDISDVKGIPLAKYASDKFSDLKHQIQDFKLIGSTTNNTLTGSPAYKSMYTYGTPQNTTKGMEIGAIKGDKVFILTYEAGANEYDKYLPIVQQLIKSFQIASSQPTKLL
ncbi:MAG: PsbP-related protein [Candidatus Nitrosopolaris sp.]